jgi:hypothetical protein
LDVNLKTSTPIVAQDHRLINDSFPIREVKQRKKLRSPETKCHLDVSLVERHKVNPMKGGRQQPLQSLDKLKYYRGGRKCHHPLALSFPRMFI